MDDWVSTLLRGYQGLRDIRFDASTMPTRGYRAAGTILEDAIINIDAANGTTVRVANEPGSGDGEVHPWRVNVPDEEFYETATGEIRHRGDEREIYMLNPWENTWAETAPKAYEDTIDRRAWWDWVNGMSITFDEKGRKASRDIAVPSEDEKVDKRYMEALADSEKKLDSFLDEFTVTDNA